MRKIVPLLVLLLVPACLWTADFGLALNQEVGYGGINDDTDIDYTAILVPHFSTHLGDSADLLISAGLNIVYEYEELSVVPELLHTELTLRFNSLSVRAGRVPYADPLDFVIEGFFDGAQALFDTSAGIFSAGAWYTGLLYKKSANITMTLSDDLAYYVPVDYDDFSNTYFASKRMLLAAGWEHPSIAGIMRLRAAVSGQLDLNDTENPFNSTYISGKALMPVKDFIFRAGLGIGIFSFLEETGAGFAGELGASWALPTPFASQFSLDWRYSTGHSDTIKAFVPFTTQAQGDILEAKLSGLTVFLLDYTAQLHPSLSFSLSNWYFIRTDRGTYNIYPVTNPTDYYLGTEVFGRFTWSPLSDLSLNLGGGIFIPASGFEADPTWGVEIGLALILF